MFYCLNSHKDRNLHYKILIAFTSEIFLSVEKKITKMTVTKLYGSDEENTAKSYQVVVVYTEENICLRDKFIVGSITFL